MKRRWTALALACALLLLLAACGEGGNAPADPSEKPTASAQQPDTQPSGQFPESKELAITELYSEDGSYEDMWGAGCDYSYHVPQLDADTPDAASINSEIAAFFGAAVEVSLQSMEDGVSPGVVSVTYESFRSGDVLSLVVKCIYYYGYFEDYCVYNYDVAAGKQLDNGDLLALLGIGEEDFLTAARRAAAQSFDEQIFPIWEDYGFAEFPGLYQELRSRTISSENITPNLMLYLDGGEGHVIVPIDNFTEAGWVYTVLELEPGKSTGADLTADYGGFLSAALRDGELTLRLEKTAELADLLELCDYTGQPPYGRDIPVHGLYSDYTQVFCGVMGDPALPYVFLLTDAGRVEYVDVLTCLKGGYFCAGGPLMGLEGVASFACGLADDGTETVYASCFSGERVDVTSLIIEDQTVMYDSFLNDWAAEVTQRTDGGGSYEESCFLSLVGCDSVYLQVSCFDVDPEFTFLYAGSFTLLGMTEDGLVYYYCLWSEDGGSPLEGTAALHTGIAEEWDDFNYTLFFKELSGGMIYNVPGETTEFYITYG
ncbi:MAG: hypothetical protein ACI3XJ_02485 [Oscillospiraceae bacterium]